MNLKFTLSKTYLILSAAIYALLLFAIWHYAYPLWFSLSASFIVSIQGYYFVKKTLLLAPKPITIDNTSIYLLGKKHTFFDCVYQSSFLVIISVDQHSIVIFRDALIGSSFSALRRVVNAKR